MTGMTRRSSSALVAMVVLCFAAPASSAEICITCVGPDVTYRCSAEGFDGAGATDPRLQLLCITELARSGGHQSCSTDRRKLTCEGVLRVVAPPPQLAPEPQPTSPGQAEAAPPPPPAGGVTTVPKNSGPAPEPPETVEQLAKDAAHTSKENLEKVGEAVKDGAKTAGEQIENAGSAVGSAAKKTWDCVTSLFKEC